MLLLILLQTPAPQSGSPLLGLLPMLLIFVVFYFLLILPMQRQRRRQQAMLSTLESGQEVITSGGIIGQIVQVNKDNDTLVVRVRPDGVKLQITRSAVSSVVSGEKK